MILARPSSLGRGTTTLLDNLPGRVSAASKTCNTICHHTAASYLRKGDKQTAWTSLALNSNQLHKTKECLPVIVDVL